MKIGSIETIGKDEKELKKREVPGLKNRRIRGGGGDNDDLGGNGGGGNRGGGDKNKSDKEFFDELNEYPFKQIPNRNGIFVLSCFNDLWWFDRGLYCYLNQWCYGMATLFTSHSYLD